jgi:hypothetical protein
MHDFTAGSSSITKHMFENMPGLWEETWAITLCPQGAASYSFISAVCWLLLRPPKSNYTWLLIPCWWDATTSSGNSSSVSESSSSSDSSSSKTINPENAENSTPAECPRFLVLEVTLSSNSSRSSFWLGSNENYCILFWFALFTRFEKFIFGTLFSAIDSFYFYIF